MNKTEDMDDLLGDAPVAKPAKPKAKPAAAAKPKAKPAAATKPKAKPAAAAKPKPKAKAQAAREVVPLNAEGREALAKRLLPKLKKGEFQRTKDLAAKLDVPTWHVGATADWLSGDKRCKVKKEGTTKLVAGV